MKIKSQRDFASGLMFLVAGVVFAVAATLHPMGTSVRPGAGLLPLMLAVIMAVLGAVILFKSLTIETEGGDPIGAIAWRPLVAVIAAVSVFGVSMQQSGLLVSVPLAVVIASLGSRSFSWRTAVAGAFALTLAAWLLITWGLPSGLLPKLASPGG